MRTWKITISLFLVLIFLMAQIAYSNPEKKNKKTALLLIDIQNFYFPGGRLPLENPEKASLNSRKILESFRERGRLIVHIKHNAKSGADIHKSVAPLKEEKIISKNYANSFKDTGLLEYLRSHKISHIVICGMMTHMCVEAAARAASDLDFDVILIGDAFATRDLKYGHREIKAMDVHCSTLSSLDGYYAKVLNTEEYLKSIVINQ